MAQKRSGKENKVNKSSRPKKSGRTRASNPYNTVFENDTQAKWYSALIKRKLTQTRYMCKNTLSTLRLKSEIDKMFPSIGLLEFMQREAPTYECITLEFLRTLDLKLLKKGIDDSRYYYANLRFRLFNQNHELSVEDLGHILRFPFYGAEDVPSEFHIKKFLANIIGNRFYTAIGEKAPTIQNPCFCYAQMALVTPCLARR